MGVHHELGQLTRSALGRNGFIGELYDARTEKFTSRSLLKSSFPKELIECRDVGKIDCDYRLTESISDRFSLMQVEGELQVSVLCGLVNVCGSGTFLKEEKKSQKTVSCSLICSLQTVCEKLVASFGEIVHHFDLSVLEGSQNTHVVVEINWGANCLLTMEASLNSESEREDVKGSLKSELSFLSSLVKMDGGGGIKKEGLNLGRKNDVKIMVSADVMPDTGWPTSPEQFSLFVKELPSLAKKLNGGKGKPLNYVMIPLSVIRQASKVEVMTETIVKAVDESFLFSIVCLFEDISDVKKKLFDFVQDMTEYKKFIREEDFRAGRDRLASLQEKESSLKELLGDDWTRVRSGEKSLRDLVKAVERFKNRDLNLYSYEDYLDSCDSVRGRISEVRTCQSYGVVCLGRGEKLEEISAQNLNSELIVFVSCQKFKTADPDLFRNTYYYFLTLAHDRKPNTIYVAVDVDYCGENRTDPLVLYKIVISETRCFCVKGTKVLSSNLFADYAFEASANLVRCKADVQVEYIRHKPANRVVLEMVCPGFRSGSCPSEGVAWKCAKCKSDVEYGFDEFYYCLCGRASTSSFEYRCGVPQHGDEFLPSSPEFLKQMLSALRPLKEMNVLILGESGVGKSTWINSIVNYLSYETLDKAKEEGVIATIPIAFSVVDPKTGKKHEVRIGHESDNEEREVGLSGTRHPRTYNFLWEDKCVRLIDTPGLLDTSGIFRDKENMKSIFDHISNLKEIHGVCILLKANRSRFGTTFSYCLKEFLIHMHKSVTKNIVFCFTNARNSFYSPGQTSVILGKVLEEIGISQELPLGKHNMFCLDNEAFLFLCTLDVPEIQYQEKLVESFGQSWQISLEETRRLFRTVKSFVPHSLEETMSLVTARTRILSLTKPIAEVSKTIHMNVALMERKKAAITESEETLQELMKKLHVQEIFLEPVPLSRPRTVCTNPRCVAYHKYQGLDVNEIEYKTICHDECYLSDVEPKTVNNALLKGCLAMCDGKCTGCGCGWENHMHMVYGQKRVERMGENPHVKKDIQEKQSEKEQLEQFINDLSTKIDKYKEELKIIIQTSVKFGGFLKKNAISVYNDSVKEHLEHLLKEEENKLEKTQAEEELIKSMKETLAHYQAEVMVLEDVVRKSDDQAEPITVKDILKMENMLYNLELTGEEIRNCAQLGRTTQSNLHQYCEIPIQIKTGRQKSSSSSLGNAMEKIKHKVQDGFKRFF